MDRVRESSGTRPLASTRQAPVPILSDLTLFGQKLVGFSQIHCPHVFIRPDALRTMISPQRTRLQSSQSRAMRALDPHPPGKGSLVKSVRSPRSSIGHRVQGASIV